MIRGGVRRLARMNATEIRWRAKSRGHALMDRVTTGLITPVWRREHLLRALAIDSGLAQSVTAASTLAGCASNCPAFAARPAIRGGSPPKAA
jgi:hypothetical protein